MLQLTSKLSHTDSFSPILEKGCHPTGSVVLDMALGTNGWTKSRLIELSGLNGSGKTTLALHSIAACQMAGGVAAFLDSEYALHAPYARSVGVDVNELIYSEPSTMEQAFVTAERLIKSGAIDLLVMDSITSLLPECQRELVFDDSRSYALEHSNELAKGLTQLRMLIKGTGTSVIFTNQMRQGEDGRVVSTGGRPVRNLMATRVRLSLGDSIVKDSSIVGHHCQMRVDKHKDGKCGTFVSIPMLHKRGFAQSYETLSEGLSSGVVLHSKIGYFAENGRFLGSTSYQARETLDKWPNLRLCINRELLRQFCYSQ